MANDPIKNTEKQKKEKNESRKSVKDSKEKKGQFSPDPTEKIEKKPFDHEKEEYNDEEDEEEVPLQKNGFFKLTKDLFKELSVPKITYMIPFMLAFLRSGISLATPYYFKIIMDLFSTPQQFAQFEQILWILIILNTIGFIINSLIQRAFQHLGIQTIYDLRHKIYTHLQGLSLRYHNLNRKGKNIAYLTNDAEAVNGLISNSLINLVLSAIQLVGSLVFMIILSWQMCLILVIIMPTFFLITRYFSRQAHIRAEKERTAVNEITSQTQEIMDGLRTIRDLNSASLIESKFGKWVQKEVEGRRYAQALWSIMGPFNQFFNYFSVGLVILFGANLAINGKVTLGTIFAFILYLQQFSGPLQQIAQFFSDIQRANVGGQHILQLLRTPSDIQNSTHPIPLNDLQGEIEFRNVSFAYSKVEVLSNINLQIQARQRIAIVGPTGAGKTTIGSLIARFYDVKSGEIVLDHQNIKDYSLQTLRHKIGMVLQDPFLFNESVMENIRYGKPSANESEVITITQKIGIHDFITKLPEGYHTLVGERGNYLSVGQCQLIAIARTLLANPPILILDEATSSVDAYSELLIQKALDELLKTRTCIIIAHRFSTILSADNILVMDHGRIIQQGSHSQLVHQDGLYQKFYKMQFAENQL